MDLSHFASTLLLGSTWEDKLLSSKDGFEDDRTLPALTEIPKFPGRPRKLARFGRSEFPKIETLAEASARGRLLHFFANHELLAMELMALTLLKFPGAERSFRLGLARTIVEEQKHLRMYVQRMRELGVDFGELPVSDYFWNALKDGRSPLEFVVQMSMTLEQANLDYSLFYQRAVAAVGDGKTAELLETVFQEEIGHVKHGVTWFNRWRGPSDEDDWDAYVRLLPPPMNPRRAKGPVFCAAARREAGLSERYIREMDVHSGSKGRPPSYWIFNALCESEIARGKPGFTGSKSIRDLVHDLETVPAFLARDADVVLLETSPRAGWLKSLQDAGFALPEFRERRPVEAFPERHVAGVEPWGWSPDVFELFRGAASKLISIKGGNGHWSRSLLEKKSFAETNLGPLFSKAWSVGFYRAWMEKHPEDASIFGPGIVFSETLGRVFFDWSSAREYLKEALSRSETILAKAPWGTSGTMNKRVVAVGELDSPLAKWMEKILETQGSIVLEPWLEKVADLSIQVEVGETPKVFESRTFLTGKRLEYRGTFLGQRSASLTPDENRFLHRGPTGTSPLARWSQMAEAIGKALYAEGYEGNAGIDALLATRNGRLFLRPVVEVNPRWTMGRVALELEKRVLPGASAAWLFLTTAALRDRGLPDDFADAARVLANRHPVKRQTKSGKEWIAEGVVFTNDPEAAREVLSVLAVGESATSTLLAAESSLRDSRRNAPQRRG